MQLSKSGEGNHRISAWLASQTPRTLPAVIFVGKPNHHRPFQLGFSRSIKKGKGAFLRL